MFHRRESCPSCNGTEFHELHRIPFSDPGISRFLQTYYNRIAAERQSSALSGGNFVVMRCSSCGLLFQEGVPDDALLDELYGEWLGFNDPLAPHKPHMPLDHYAYLAQEVLQVFAMLRARRPDAPRLRVLDFGMGWGHWSEMARACGAEVCGAELSPNKVAHARQRGFEVADLDALAGRQFDFINTEQVVEHLPEPRPMVERLSNLLAPGGLLKLSVPDGSGTAAVLEGWDWTNAYARRDDIMPVHPLEHLNCFTPDSLHRFAQLCGLRREKVPLKIAYGYPGDWSTARAAAKSIVRPIKRFVMMRGCYALFSRVD